MEFQILWLNPANEFHLNLNDAAPAINDASATGLQIFHAGVETHTAYVGTDMMLPIQAIHEAFERFIISHSRPSLIRV